MGDLTFSEQKQRNGLGWGKREVGEGTGVEGEVKLLSEYKINN